jgi:hypothetical protein
MKRRITLATVIAALSVVMASPADLRGQQATDPADHAAHHPDASATQVAAPATPAPMASMMSNAKVDELVKKMNAAKGTAKTEAMAELLTALVQDRRACEPMMANMMKMMETMHGPNATMPMQPPAK